MRTGKLLIFMTILALTLGVWAAIAAAAPAGPDGDTRTTIVEKAPISISSPARTPGKVTPAAHPEAVLWDQPLSTVNQGAYVNQEFSDFPAYSSFLADDFTNPAPWNITTIFVPGDGWNGFTTLFNATALTWQIYADNAGVPDGDPSGGGNPPVWTLTLTPTDPQVVIGNGTPGGLPSNTTLNLATPVNLPPGHWWLVFYPTLDFTNYGQYGRQAADTANGYTAQFINPGGGFGYGTAWQAWTVIGPTQQDIAFRLEGDVAPSIVWDKTIDGVPWTPQMQITRQTSDTIVVQEVLHLTPPMPSRESSAVQPAASPPRSRQVYADGVASDSPAPAPPQAALTAIPPPPGAIVISFDDVTAPCNFGDTTALRDAYAGLGVLFMGPAVNDGGGIVNECGGWGVSGYSPPNFLGFNQNAFFSDGGIPRPPETIMFINGANYVQVNVGSCSGAGQIVTMEAFDAPGISLGSDSLVLACTLNTLAITANGISYVVIDSPAHFVLDDLAFLPGAPAFAQIETWNPEHLRLLDWAATGGEVFIGVGRVEWTGEIIAPATITLTKWFHVEPCTWTETVLWEELWLDQTELEQRPVLVNKLAPVLWIDSVGGGDVLAGEPAQFTLLFGNTGGFDNDVWIRNDFPPTAPFVSSVPPPTNVDPGGLWAEWYVAGLPQGAQGAIDVTVMIEPTLPPSTTIEIWDGIFDHTGALRDWVIIIFHVRSPEQYIYLPVVYKNFVAHP